MKCPNHPDAPLRPVETWEYYRNGKKLKEPRRVVVYECTVCKREVGQD